MPLSTDVVVPVFASKEMLDLPVDDNATILKGEFVGRNRTTGYFRALVNGDDYVGLAYAAVDNTGAGHAAGAVNVRVWQDVDATFTLSGATLADVGRTVYGSNSSTPTLNAGVGSRVGRIVAVEGTDVVRVRLSPLFSTSHVENGFFATLSDATQTLGIEHANKTLLMGNTAARTVTLPSVGTLRAGAWLRIVKTTAAAFAITLDAAGSETIDGSLTYAGIDAQYDTALLLCTGSEWIILSRDIA